jgi:hypothetical protein
MWGFSAYSLDSSKLRMNSYAWPMLHLRRKVSTWKYKQYLFREIVVFPHIFHIVLIFTEQGEKLVFLTGPIITDDFVNPKKRLLDAWFLRG